MPKARSVDSAAPPEVVWALLSRPALWSRWSPHVGGAEGLGSPEVESGREGHVVLRGGVRIPARITEVTPGESWAWRVGGIELRHTVVPRFGGGSRIEHVVQGSGLPWSAASLAYAPVVGLVARNLARVAEREAGRA